MVARSPPPVKFSLGNASEQGRQTGCCVEVCAGWALYLCRLCQGAMVSQKAMSSLNSSLTTTDAAPQTELCCERTATQVSGYRVYPALTPVQASCSEHTCGRCAQVEEHLPLSDRALGGDE